MPWRETPAEIERARAEQPMRIEAAEGTLFGVYTPAAPSASPTGRCVVLLTRPRSHRNRMWIEGARRWRLAVGHAAALARRIGPRKRRRVPTLHACNVRCHVASI